MPKDVNPLELSLEDAIFLISLPKKIGALDEHDISLGIGKYGPYVSYNGKFYSVKSFENLKTLTADSVIKNLLQNKNAKV